MKNRPAKIIFIHSLNNYTGSPNVLSVVIRGLIERGYDAELITSRGNGFLSNIAGLRHHYTSFNWCDSKLKTLMLLIVSQCALFFRILFHPRKNIYYINTITPFGAILACWLTRKNFVIHVHENMCQNKAIYKLYRTIYKRCNQKSLFVSHYLEGTALNCRRGKVVYNGLNSNFRHLATQFLNTTHNHVGQTVLMAASLRRFKGIYEFVELARRMPKYNFELVLSATAAEVEVFQKEIGDITNLTLYSEQSDMHPFYQRAKLLLLLSLPELWVETFGLTILEAMVYGVPAIVPDAGGPKELVENDVNGYRIDPHDIDAIRTKIEKLLSDDKLYHTFSDNALKISTRFTQDNMINEIENYIK